MKDIIEFYISVGIILLLNSLSYVLVGAEITCLGNLCLGIILIVLAITFKKTERRSNVRRIKTKTSK